MLACGLSAACATGGATRHKSYILPALSGIGGLTGYAVGQWVGAAYISRLDLGADLPLRFDTSFDLGVGCSVS